MKNPNQPDRDLIADLWHEIVKLQGNMMDWKVPEKYQHCSISITLRSGPEGVSVYFGVAAPVLNEANRICPGHRLHGIQYGDFIEGKYGDVVSHVRSMCDSIMATWTQKKP